MEHDLLKQLGNIRDRLTYIIGNTPAPMTAIGQSMVQEFKSLKIEIDTMTHSVTAWLAQPPGAYALNKLHAIRGRVAYIIESLPPGTTGHTETGYLKAQVEELITMARTGRTEAEPAPERHVPIIGGVEHQTLKELQEQTAILTSLVIEIQKLHRYFRGN